MRWEVLLIAGLTLMAGCLGAMEAQEGDGDAEPAAASPATSVGGAGEVQQVERTLVFTANVSGPQIVDERVGPSWDEFLGPSLVAMDLSLSWEEPTNGFGVDVELPDGSTHELAPPAAPMATSVEGEVPDPMAGAFGFHLTTDDSVVSEDTVRLAVTVVLEIPVDTPVSGAEGDVVRGPVAVEEVEEGYRAETIYRANGTVEDAITLEVDTVNGAVHAGEGTHPSGVDEEQAYAAVTVWAIGDTREEARQRVLEIQVTLSIEPAHVRAIAEAEDWEERGANADVALPADTQVDADLDTTNGGITMAGLTVTDVVADTTNGQITGDVRGEGELAFDTTNGAIDVAFTPTGTTSLTADTTNGAIQLALNEEASRGYEIHASTTNGALSEDMEEASLEGTEDEATLRTDGYEDRSIQVTGEADTTNGNLHFASR